MLSSCPSTSNWNAFLNASINAGLVASTTPPIDSCSAWHGLTTIGSTILVSPAQSDPSASHVQHLLARKLRALLDELEARLGPVAHEPFDGAFGRLALLLHDSDAQQRALARVHRGLLELPRHHLAKALEAADLDLGVGVEFLFDDLVLVLVVARVKHFAAVREPVERRDRQIEVAAVDQFRHLPVEERDEQRG